MIIDLNIGTLGEIRTHKTTLLRRRCLPSCITSARNDFGTDGGIRTHTALVLSEVPPANWATPAYSAPPQRMSISS